MYEVCARIDGEPRESSIKLAIHDKYSDDVVGQLHVSSPADLDAALASATDAPRLAPLRPSDRADILRGAIEVLRGHREELVEQHRVEAGFTNKDGERDISRALDALMLCADEALRFNGRSVPLSAGRDVRNRIGLTIRKPVGVVAAITPFNSPFGTVIHKVGPALAAGNAVVLKPAENTPSPAVVIADALAQAGLPAPWLQVVQGPGETVGAGLVADPRVNFVAFTGSTQAGASVHAAAGLRRTALELGSISCTVIARDAHLSDTLAANIANASFRKAGQVCTSVQRIYVHRDVEGEFTKAFIERARQLRIGDPNDPATDVGPLISPEAAERVEQWIRDSERAGAKVLVGGERTGTSITPAVLANVTPGMTLHDQEVFGPVACLYVYDDDDDVIDEINATPYGLASGIFTYDLGRAMKFAERLDVGTVHVNGTSSNRVDIMPYGGHKASGHGLEGPAYAVADMSVETLLSLQWDV